MGAMYLGYQNHRFGANSEQIRDFWQNHLAHHDGYPTKNHWRGIFEVLPGLTSAYYSYQTKNPFTSWSR